jgi:P3 major capsid protein
MATPNVPQQQQQQMTPQTQDAIATRAILASAVERVQIVGSQQVFPASNPTMLVQPVNVGLIKRFTILVQGHISNTGTVALNLTEFGLANLFGQGGVQYTDLNNYLRVNTSGAHLAMLASAKRRRSYGATYDDNQTNGVNRSKMLNVAPANWGVFQVEDTIAIGNSGFFSAVFEVPLAYTDDDLRGSIWANVLNAVQQLSLTFNPQPVTADPQDSTFAVYSGAGGASGAITDVMVTVYQEYLDQLPKAQGPQGPIVILPALSLSTVYELKSTVFQNVPANQEFFIPYANQRSFISTFATFNHDGTATGRTLGSDINYWALLSANSTYIWKMFPLIAALKSREHLMSDLPAGTYYFPSRRHNIASLQFGNLQLTVSTTDGGGVAPITPASYINVMWEAFALQNTLASGASLAS